MTTEKHNSLPQTDVEDSVSVHAKMDPEDQEQKDRASESRFGHYESPEWKAAERRVVRKLDMTLMPMVWILYMFNYLDRNNIALVPPYPRSVSHRPRALRYGIASIKGLMNFAVYLEDVAMYNYALWSWKNDPCAGIGSTINSKTGQNSESGRDQNHAIIGLGWLALAARTSKNQGYDLFSYSNNLLLKGSEYTAKYNLNETVPYDSNWRRCESVLVIGPWDVISTDKRGVAVETATGYTKSAPVWSLLHYAAQSRGLKSPWTSKAKAAYDAAGGEVAISGNDMPSWGSLLFAA